MKWDQVGQVGHGISTALLIFAFFFNIGEMGCVILLPAHPASFVHNFVSGMQRFYFSESQEWTGCNSIADLSLKIVLWTHKQALKYLKIGTCPASQKILAYMWEILIFTRNIKIFTGPAA